MRRHHLNEISDNEQDYTLRTIQLIGERIGPLAKSVRSIKEPLDVQVPLSFVQTVVGVTWSACSLGFKRAKAQMSHPLETVLWFL